MGKLRLVINGYYGISFTNLNQQKSHKFVFIFLLIKRMKSRNFICGKRIVCANFLEKTNPKYLPLPLTGICVRTKYLALGWTFDEKIQIKEPLMQLFLMTQMK